MRVKMRPLEVGGFVRGGWPDLRRGSEEWKRAWCCFQAIDPTDREPFPLPSAKQIVVKGTEPS